MVGRGVCMAGGVHGMGEGSVHGRGCAWHGGCACMTGETVTTAHPTGMHSC